MEKHACKLCFKRFPTGRALGGHMRCHAAASDEVPPPPSEGWMQSYLLHENPRKRIDSDADPNPPLNSTASDPNVVVAARCRRRPRRRNRQSPSAPSPTSRRRRTWQYPSFSSPARHGSWKIAVSDDHSAEAVEQIAVFDHSAELIKQIVSFDHLAEDNQIIAGKQQRSMPDPMESPQEVRCENCRKDFSSCQDLGGHRASYKKRNVSCAATE